MLRVWRLVLPLLLLCGGAAAGDVAAAAGAKQAQAAEQPSLPSAAAAANALIANGYFKEGEAFLRQTLARAEPPPKPDDVLFYFLALALAGQGKHAAAAEALRSILDFNPQLVRVRAALGRVLFLQGHDAAAQRQFDLVLGDKQAGGLMHKSARQHLAAIRARSGWSYSFAVNMSESDNVHNAPDAGAVIFIGGLPFGADEEKARGLRFSWSGAATYRRQAGARRQWEGGLAVSGDGAPGNLDGGAAVQVNGGPRFLFGRGALAFSAFGGYSWSGGQPSSRNVGLQGQLVRVLPLGWRAFVSAQGSHQNNVNNDDADTRVLGGRAGLNFGLSRTVSGDVHVSGTEARARLPLYSYFSAGAGVNVQRDFGWGVTAGAGFSITRTLYEEASRLLGHRQRDVSSNLSVFVLKRDWRLFGFAPKLSYSRNRKLSNVATAEYQSNVTAVNFTRNF